VKTLLLEATTATAEAIAPFQQYHPLAQGARPQRRRHAAKATANDEG
jgi:hypothetical protein